MGEMMNIVLIVVAIVCSLISFWFFSEYYEQKKKEDGRVHEIASAMISGKDPFMVAARQARSEKSSDKPKQADWNKGLFFLILASGIIIFLIYSC